MRGDDNTDPRLSLGGLDRMPTAPTRGPIRLLGEGVSSFLNVWAKGLPYRVASSFLSIMPRKPKPLPTWETHTARAKPARLGDRWGAGC
jgi:hypothetical protein